MMLSLIMLLGRDSIYVYEKRGNRYARLHIEGRAAFPFDLNHADAVAERLVQALANEFNLERVSELELTMIDNEDPLHTEVARRAFADRIVKTVDLTQVLTKAMQRLSRDKELKVQEFGVDFDGVHYTLAQSQLRKGPFDLLAYHLDPDALVNLWE